MYFFISKVFLENESNLFTSVLLNSISDFTRFDSDVVKCKVYKMSGHTQWEV